MDKQDLILKKIETTQADIVEIKINQGKNQVILQEHMRRTEANEQRLQRLEDFKWYFAGIAVIMTVAIEMFRRFL